MLAAMRSEISVALALSGTPDVRALGRDSLLQAVAD
jgi:hypothetical protein